ncbi:MAG: redoxin domain-containing protein [Chitinophaga sp.]|uniref:redoxin domain-containing protein n=1 Tax=Chitinophaga sp. TaxID=1869181 RepID=UPI0025C0A959|nr:redoxin domain-containing protein [Chitinophaga sp.]MBV8255541.1 redoxin domain-containing protein [Chitinophaga sp.]
MRYFIHTIVTFFLCTMLVKAQEKETDILPFRSAAPAFSLSATNGRQVRLTDFKGKMVVIYCWDNQDKNSHVLDTIKTALKDYADDTAIVFLAVTRQSIAPGVLPKKSRLINAVIPANSTDAHAQAFLKDYNIMALPRTIMIGRKGDIILAQLPEGLFSMFLKMWSQVEERSDEANHSTYWDYKARPGDLIPGNIKLQVVDGKSYTMAELRGQVVLLEFTASWCGVCRELMPHLEKEFWQAYKDKGLKVFGIDLKESPATIRKLASATGVTYPLVPDVDGKIFYHFVRDLGSVTKVLLIDKTGHIVYLSNQKMGEAEQSVLREKIVSLL